VVGKDMPARTVFVAAGRDHAALYTQSALLSGASWVAGEPPVQLMQVPTTTIACSRLSCGESHED